MFNIDFVRKSANHIILGQINCNRIIMYILLLYIIMYIMYILSTSTFWSHEIRQNIFNTNYSWKHPMVLIIGG